jgi:hypothetical protein
MNGGTLTLNGPAYLGAYSWTTSYILQTGGLIDANYIHVGCGVHDASTIEVTGGTFMAQRLNMHALKH